MAGSTGRGYTHFSKPSGKLGLFVGVAGSEVQVADANGIPYVAGTAIASTAAEIDRQCDVSANAETIVKSGVVSVTKLNTKINSTTGTGAVTLAAPDASVYGKVKTIEMTVDGGDITLALTNVQGQSSGTTATFNDVGDTLVLVAGTSKWNVIGEIGIGLS